MQTFNILGQVKDELSDFFDTKIKIGAAVVDGREIGGYEYSQWDTIQNIEFVDNSKFLSGDRDSEGQQKFYLNIASFRKEVASKNIDLDVKNFLFIPEEDQYESGTILVRKKFRRWSKDQGLSEKLNDSVDRFPKYGTVVSKRVGKETEIVPILKLRNEQGAESLKKASYVIQEHSNVTKEEIEEMPDWDASNLDIHMGDKITVYERYGYVPLSILKKNRGEEPKDGDDEVSRYAVAFITFDKAKTENEDGAILFMEETECPYQEAHYTKQDGRWLGIGEIEKQFENQAARNMIFNLRKKNLSWSAKNIFQTQDDTVVNNLVREVRDGDVMKMSTPNGIQRVDTSNRAGGDFNSMDQVVEQNSDQRSFSFEVATGESLPSATPFRLGAIVGQSANAYYGLKREKLSFLWKNIVINDMLPQFEKENTKEFIEGIFETDEGFAVLRQAKKDALKTEAFKKAMLEGLPIDGEAVDLVIESLLEDKDKDFWKIPAGYFKGLKYRFDIDITGESIDIPKKIETLTTLHQQLLAAGDLERADAVLKDIMILAGEKMPKATTLAAPTAGQPGQQAASGGGFGEAQQAQVAANQPGAEV